MTGINTMKSRLLTVLLFLSMLLIGLVSCTPDTPPVETEGGSITQTTAEAPTEEPTDASETQPIEDNRREFRVVGYVPGNLESSERLATFDSGHLDHLFFEVLGILKPFANFAEGEFAPSNARRLSKKGLSRRRHVLFSMLFIK